MGAHYREAIRAKSIADFINKIEGTLQELEETSYWLEPLAESNLMKPEKLEPLVKEAGELTSILVTMILKVKARAK